MTITEMRERFPDLFHPNQDWFEGETFMAENFPPGAPSTPPTYATYLGVPPEYALDYAAGMVPAVALAGLYVMHPTAEIWKSCLWTASRDSQGQRVYVVDNGKGLEIHRHLHITQRFGVPQWTS